MLRIMVLFSFFAIGAGGVELKQNDQLLSGVWLDRPYVAESNCYVLLLLFADHTFAMSECLEDRTLCQKTETIGRWTFKGKVFELDVTKRAKFTTKFEVTDICEGCCYDVKPVVKLFSPPHMKSFSCILSPGGPDLSAQNGSHCWEMTLNGRRYWQFKVKIEEYCELISLAKEICPNQIRTGSSAN